MAIRDYAVTFRVGPNWGDNHVEYVRAYDAKDAVEQVRVKCRIADPAGYIVSVEPHDLHTKARG